MCFHEHERQTLVVPGGPCELPLTGDLRDWEQEQPRNQGITENTPSFMEHSAVRAHQCFICVIIYLMCFFLSSHQMTRTVTTATNVSSACLTCETHSSCPADICVSATPVQTHCVTKPTTVPSAGCVRRATIFYNEALAFGVLYKCYLKSSQSLTRWIN